MSADKIDKTGDPYAGILVEERKVWIFHPGLLLRIAHAFVLAGLASVVFFAGQSFFASEYLTAIFLLTFGIIVFPGTFRIYPKLVTGTQSHLTIEFFFWKPTLVTWDQIRSLRIRRGRGTWANLQTDKGEFFIPVEYGGIKDSRELMKLIIQKAHLAFKEGRSFGRAYYKGKKAELL